MAQRAWLVRPDHEITAIAEDGQDYLLAAVSQQALAQAVLDGVTMMHRAGGCLAVTVARQPTGIPKERVTTGAMVEWKDRTDARPQPESDGAPLAVVPDPPVEEAELVEELEAELPEVDESSVPVALRSE